MTIAIDTIRAVAAALTEAADVTVRLDDIKREIAAGEATVAAAALRAANLESAFDARHAQYEAEAEAHRTQLAEIDALRAERIQAADLAASAIIADARRQAEQLVRDAEATANEAREATRVIYAKHEDGIAELDARRKAAEQTIATEQARVAEIRAEADAEQARLDAIRAAIRGAAAV